MSERLTDAVREQAEAIWQIGNRHGPDAERKQDIAESLATFTEALRARVAQLEAALEQSVELQSHYAELLNMYDGGQRLTFANVEAWLDRLDALKDAPQ